MTMYRQVSLSSLMSTNIPTFSPMSEKGNRCRASEIIPNGARRGRGFVFSSRTYYVADITVLVANRGKERESSISYLLFTSQQRAHGMGKEFKLSSGAGHISANGSA